MRENHCRYFILAGITIQVESDLPFTDTTFHEKFKKFESNGPGDDTIVIKHHFGRLPLKQVQGGQLVYANTPWNIYRKAGNWIYVGKTSVRWSRRRFYQISMINHDHTIIEVYNRKKRAFCKGNLHSLTLFPTDQIILARTLSNRQGCYLHAGGVIFDGSGLLFAGHSGAGKSTIITLLKQTSEVLCDDRIVLRQWPDGFRIHGTWNHGDVPDIYSGSAPLKGIFFLEKAADNRLVHIIDKGKAIKRIIPCLIKPLLTTQWWNQMLTLAENITREIPVYSLYFNKSGKIVDLLRQL